MSVLHERGPGSPPPLEIAPTPTNPSTNPISPHGADPNRSHKSNDVELKSRGGQNSGNTNVIADEANGAPNLKTRKSLAFHLAFAGLAITLLVFQIDLTCLSVALPTISLDLNGSTLHAFWANLAFNLCSLVAHPIWASISQAFGRKYPLYASVVVFLVGSIVFALAQNMDTLIIGRVLQGVGGGGIDVLTTIVLADMTTLEERGQYLGLLSIPSAIGNIIGSFVGALFSTYASWRWIGWINLPILGVGGLLLVFFLKLRPVPLGATLAANLSRLDWVGMSLIIVGTTVFCLPISWAGSLFPWSSWQTLVPFFVGAANLVVFGFYEAKPAAPTMPHRLFVTKTGNMALAGGLIHGMVLIAMLQYLPLFYQSVELETAIRGAVLLLPTLIISVLFAAISMMMLPLFGGYVWLLRFSWVVLGLGAGILGVIQLGASDAMLYGLPIIYGLGVSLLRLTLLPAQASVKQVDDEGLATANFSTIRMFGALVGLAISSIFTSVFSASLSKTSLELTGELSPLRDASNAINFIGELRSLRVPTSSLDEVLCFYLESFRAIFYTMAGLSGLGLITSVFLDELSLKREEMGTQRFEES